MRRAQGEGLVPDIQVQHDYVPCFQEQMALVYDPVLNVYRNIPGVETRVPNFGSSYGFSEKMIVP